MSPILEFMPANPFYLVFLRTALPRYAQKAACDEISEEFGTAVTGQYQGRQMFGSSTLTMQRVMDSLFARFGDLVRKMKSNTAESSTIRSHDTTASDITIIALVKRNVDGRLISAVGKRNRWNVLFSDTCEEARAALDQAKVPVILYDRDLPGRSWQEGVETLASSPRNVCIILVSSVIDNYLWNEMVSRGGYEILSKPLREDEVVRAIKLAESYWATMDGTEAPRARQP